MPPDFSKLPTPISEENLDNDKDLEIEDILNSNISEKNSENKPATNTSLEQSILKKIKNN